MQPLNELPMKLRWPLLERRLHDLEQADERLRESMNGIRSALWSLVICNLTILGAIVAELIKGGR